MAKTLLTIAGPTILAGRSTSNALDVTGGRPVRVIMPPLWTPASLTFLGSVDNTVFGSLYSFDGREVRLVCDGDNRWISLPPGSAAGINFLKFRSGTQYGPVNQAADRVFSVIVDTSLG